MFFLLHVVMKKVLFAGLLVLSFISISMTVEKDDDKEESRIECCCEKCSCKDCKCESDCLNCKNCLENEECHSCRDCRDSRNCCDFHRKYNVHHNKYRRGGCCGRRC